MMIKLKIQLSLVVLFTTLSCGKDFGDLNTDPNNPKIVPAETLLTSAEKMLADNHSIWDCCPNPAEALLSQTWANNNYGGGQYDFQGAFFNNWWSSFYSGALKDLLELQQVVRKHPSLIAAQDSNRIAIAKILQVYGFQVLTDCFGPVPYSDALQGEFNRAPKYDSQRDIYLGLLATLHAAINQLDEAAPSFDQSDVIYGGDVRKWKKFAHSIILRLAIRMSDVEPTIAKTEAEFSAPGVFMHNSDNASFQYLNGQPNNSPYNRQRFERGNADLGLSNILIDKTLKPLNDPRLFKFADERQGLGGGYFGRPFGQNSTVQGNDPIDHYSQPSGAAVLTKGLSNFQPTDVLRPDAKTCLLGYAEVCFALAEGAERGWNLGGGSAATWYTSGIIASMNEWGITDDNAINSYLLQSSVNYNSAPGDWKQKIGVQKWIAFFMQGIQSWIEWRRLDFQKLELPVSGVLNDVGDKVAPSRLPYPTTEQTLNAQHYSDAVNMIGNLDNLKTRVWWDVK